MIRKAAKWILIGAALLIGGLAIWGYAPDLTKEELRAKYGNAESEYVDLGGGQIIHLRDEGPNDAPALVLLHGSNGSLHDWDKWMPHLLPQFRVIRFDHPGHGLTGPHPRDDYSAKAFTDVVERVAANRGLKRFTLMGHSMGGWIAHEYAKANYHQLSALILVNPSGAKVTTPAATPLGFRLMRLPGLNRISLLFTPRTVVDKMLRGTVHDPAAITEAQIDAFWLQMRYPGNRRASVLRFDQMAARSFGAPVPKAARIVPTLILWGEQDPIIPISAAKWFASQYDQSTVEIFPRVGHRPMDENPAESSAAVIRYVQGQSAASM